MDLSEWQNISFPWMSFVSAMGKRREIWCHQQEQKIWRRGGEKGWVGAGTSHGYRDRRKSQLHGHVEERSSDYVEGEVTASWKIRLPVPEKAH